jgi:2-polyprenyl-3-methyl-5-hydroxy-6-metoxy-1,4-benzoquinol methylase
MPKKILYESAIHQLLWAGRRLQTRSLSVAPAHTETIAHWIADLSFEYPGPGALLIRWNAPNAGSHTVALKNARFYTRGDAEVHYHRQAMAGLTFADDSVMDANIAFFDEELRTMLAAASLLDARTLARLFNAPALAEEPVTPAPHDRKHAEEAFHDEWAASEDLARINVRQRNEACTAPEMRHIRKKLGNLRGRTLLDVGCGLGEASVYFAMEGAIVTATDISPGMCKAAQQLAANNGVTLTTHVSAVEDLGLKPDQKFDIIYTGNTLHHADIEATLDNILPHLQRDGVFVSWDPLAYNPIINLYRAIATKVRTEDEHPLRLRDIQAVTSRFMQSEVSWFWFTTQLIFILMVAAQFRSPNKERFWKKVIDEADSWAWLYRPLAALDGTLLTLLTFLGPLCWNVVIIAKSPRVWADLPERPLPAPVLSTHPVGQGLPA